MIWRALLVACAPFAAAATAGATDEYSFGVLNQRSPTLTAAYWNPILKHISERSGVTLKLKMGRTAQETYGMTGRGEFDFLYSNHIFTQENRPAGYKVFVRPDEDPVQGQLVVLENSPVRTLADLQDRDVAFPNPSAFLGYFLPMDALLRSGVKVKPLFSVNQEGAIGQLKAGRVAAAGVNGEVMRDYADREKIKYRIVWKSRDYLNLPVAVHPRVPEAHVRAVRDAMLRMGRDPAGKKILQASGAALKNDPILGFVRATDTDYEPQVEFYRTSMVKEH